MRRRKILFLAAFLMGISSWVPGLAQKQNWPKELEPSFGVKIWPDKDYRFCLTSIELPGDEGMPYRVSCQADFQLEELQGSLKDLPTTRVHWALHLEIGLALPKFLQVLPRKLVCRVARQVVQQVTRGLSDRFTDNVCRDFYRSIGRPDCPYRLVVVEEHDSSQ